MTRFRLSGRPFRARREGSSALVMMLYEAAERGARCFAAAAFAAGSGEPGGPQQWVTGL